SQEIAAFTPVDVISLDDEQQSLIREKMPELSLVDVAAEDEYGIDGYSTWGFGLAVAATGDMDEETAYQIVKTAHEDKTKQVSALADLEGVDISDINLVYASSPLHPGVDRFY